MSRILAAHKFIQRLFILLTPYLLGTWLPSTQVILVLLTFIALRPIATGQHHPIPQPA